MTTIPYRDQLAGGVFLEKAIEAANSGNFSDAIDHLRDLEIWAADWNDLVREEMERELAEENARSEARFGAHNMAESERYV